MAAISWGMWLLGIGTQCLWGLFYAFFLYLFIKACIHLWQEVKEDIAINRYNRSVAAKEEITKTPEVKQADTILIMNSVPLTKNDKILLALFKEMYTLIKEDVGECRADTILDLITSYIALAQIWYVMLNRESLFASNIEVVKNSEFSTLRLIPDLSKLLQAHRVYSCEDSLPETIEILFKGDNFNYPLSKKIKAHLQIIYSAYSQFTCKARELEASLLCLHFVPEGGIITKKLIMDIVPKGSPLGMFLPHNLFYTRNSNGTGELRFNSCQLKQACWDTYKPKMFQTCEELDLSDIEESDVQE